MGPIDDLETPVKEETEEPKTPKKMLYKWVTEGEEDIMKNNERFRDMIYCVPPKFMTTGSSERMKLNRFASNILDQMMVYAGVETMFPGPITTQFDLMLNNYQNRFDCGVYALKYLEMVNPTELGKTTYKIPPWCEDELAEFREQIVEYILLHHDNFYISKAVQASEPKQRASKPSRALQSPYMQLNSSDLEFWNAKHKKK
ncbi:hypothetical protein PIB30_008503 [Stylosanthes scabra]|uniref:Ubiquitin-like protease family profile domain-containing protein n=1 Tax=Stylosanthes scabra TaxID=79078 RepID=A0ABU6Y391_9FABA|nr:hypothetical protein [Stylosanthes scabra]